MADPNYRQSGGGLTDVDLHRIAQALCYLEHGDWRYDPGNRKHRKWLKRARKFARITGLGSQTMVVNMRVWTHLVSGYLEIKP